MQYDVIIIGAGLGGLIAGAKLSKGGKKVLLLEQHSIPGGCATNFRRGDFYMEVGLHEMDGLHPKDLKTRIFKDLGVFDYVNFLKVPEFYRFKSGRVDMVVPHEVEEAKKALLGNFPAEEEAINKYFNRIFDDSVKNIYQGEKPGGSVGDFLDEITQNEDMKLVFLGNLGYYHDDPYSLSLDYYCMAQRSYYTGGGNYIRGGSQQLSDYLMNYIIGKGGAVKLSHHVEKISMENGIANGVEFRSKKKGAEVEKAYARDIVANAALQNVAEMLPDNESERLMSQVNMHENSASLLTLYLGFDRPLQELGFSNYSTFVFSDSIQKQADIPTNNKADFSDRSFTFIDYGQIDSDLAPAGKSVGAICCIDYASDWENLSRSEYLQKKKEVSQIFIDRLEKLIPGVKSVLAYHELGTAKTVERYILTPGGSVYGFVQTPQKIKAEEIVSVDGLHFASAWARLGGGYSGAIYNGYVCAMNLLRRR